MSAPRVIIGPSSPISMSPIDPPEPTDLGPTASPAISGRYCQGRNDVETPIPLDRRAGPARDCRLGLDHSRPLDLSPSPRWANDHAARAAAGLGYVHRPGRCHRDPADRSAAAAHLALRRDPARANPAARNATAALRTARTQRGETILDHDRRSCT